MMDDCRTRRRDITAWCAGWARAYYHVVVTKGAAAYNAAQAKGCDACPKAAAPPGGWPIPPQPPKLCSGGPNCVGIR